MDITYFVKTFEDVCMMLNVDINKVSYGCLTKSEIAYRKLTMIAEVLNGDQYNLDFNNPNQIFYVPYFKFNIETNSFSYGIYDHWNASSYVGFGWGFKTPELAKYCGEQFIDLWNDYLLTKDKPWLAKELQKDKTII